MTGDTADDSVGSGDVLPRVLPSGTVTLLFSDVERSTGLAHSLGATWPAVLQQHRRLCRAAWASSGGIEMGTEGDSFFVVFATAQSALTAALSAQRALGDATWPEDAQVRVRIGIHTGSPMQHAEGYAGMDVHRAARVSAAAHGGQILISDATAELVRADLPVDVILLDLGEHRLKDIPHTLRLHQVAAPGLDREFAAPKTHGGAGGLPPTLTPTVGRDGELAELEATLGPGHGRLVTLTGPGGTGKTRLAIALAERLATAFPDGVHFVPLTAVTTPTGVWTAIAAVLGVPAEGHAPPAFFDHVAQRRFLVVLDNLEQIRDVDDVVRQLVTDAPHVTVVATSRRPLHVDGEYEHAVPPLVLAPTEGSFGDIESSAAIQLFVDHAHRANRAFRLTSENAADVAALCRALDGLPLAIELVAARVKLLSCRAILARIDQALDLAHQDRSRPSRQRTIRQAIAWSYDLLAPPQQAVLRALAVFEEGATLDALAHVAHVADVGTREVDLVDLLYDLVEASLVRVAEDDDGEPRFLLLQTVQRFALDQATTRGEITAAYLHHAQYFYDLAVALKDDELAGGRTFAKVARAELANLGAVAMRSVPGVRDQAHYGDQDVPVRHVAWVCCSLAFSAGRFRLADHWVQAVLQVPEAASDPLGTAGLFQLRAQMAYKLANIDQAVSYAREAMAQLQHVRPLAPALPRLDPRLIAARVVDTWANVMMESGDFDGAGELIDSLEATLQGDGDHVEAEVQGTVSELRYLMAYSTGEFARARDLLAAHVVAVEAAGPMTLAGHITLQNNLADLDLLLGDLPEAQRRLQALTPVLAGYDGMSLMFLVAATFAAVVAPTHPLVCARVFGATATARATENLPDTDWGIAEDERVMAAARALVTPEEWTAAFDLGGSEQLSDLLAEMARLPPIPRIA